jgi:protein TonB
MHLAVREGFAEFDDVAVVHPELYRYGRADDAMPRTVYGASRRGPNWLAIVLIVLMHAGALAALIMLDVIPLPRAIKHQPMVVTLIPQPAPPPPSLPRPVRAVQPLPTVVDLPPRIVAVNQPTPNIVPPPPAPQPLPIPAPAPAPAKTASVDLDAATADGAPPVYPIESRRRHEQGTVVLRVVISPEGRVKDISVASSSGFERLDKAALEAVRRWRFQPQMQGGVAVEAVGKLPIPFRLA